MGCKYPSYLYIISLAVQEILVISLVVHEILGCQQFTFRHYTCPGCNSTVRHRQINKGSMRLVECHHDYFPVRKYVPNGREHLFTLLGHNGVYSSLMLCLTLPDARLCTNTSWMSRNCPGKSSLHGCCISTDYPLRRLGGAGSGRGRLPLSNTHAHSSP
jgi:hypothetical protein